MHIVPEELKRPSKERLGSEKALKWINKAVLAIQLACCLFAIASLSVSSGKTFDTSIWGTGELRMKLIFESTFSNCTYNFTATHGAFDNIPDQISTDNLLFRFAHLASETRLMIGLACFATFAGAINRVLFDLNYFKFQYVEFIVRKDLLTVIETFCYIFVIVAATGVDTMSAPLRDYFGYCGLRSDNTMPFTAPYVEIYFLCALGLVAHFVSFIMLVFNARRRDLAPRNAAPAPEFVEQELQQPRQIEGQPHNSPMKSPHRTPRRRQLSGGPSAAAGNDSFGVAAARQQDF